MKLLPITGVPQSVNFGCGQLLRQLERQQLTVAAQLQIESSSPEMDELFCRSMDSVLLTSQHVTSGLSSFAEVVTRAAGPEEDPSLTRAIITIRDDTLQEVDCEVRAVACPSNPAGVVVCGLRRIGEPRAALHEEVGERATIGEAHPAPAQNLTAPGTEGLGLGPWVLKNLMAFWVFLRADPAPTRRPTEDPEQMRQIPVTQAVWSLSCWGGIPDFHNNCQRQTESRTSGDAWRSSRNTYAERKPESAIQFVVGTREGASGSALPRFGGHCAASRSCSCFAAAFLPSRSLKPAWQPRLSAGLSLALRDPVGLWGTEERECAFRRTSVVD